MSTTIPLAAQLACVLREIAMRHQVYKRRIMGNAMTQAQADTEIATMTAVYESLKRLQDQEAAQQALFPQEQGA